MDESEKALCLIVPEIVVKLGDICMFIVQPHPVGTGLWAMRRAAQGMIDRPHLYRGSIGKDVDHADLHKELVALQKLVCSLVDMHSELSNDDGMEVHDGNCAKFAQLG